MHGNYYACTGRQKRGPKACDGERIPREKLEDAVIEQLADIYRDGHLIRTAIEEGVATPMVCATTSSVALAGLEPASSWVR